MLNDRERRTLARIERHLIESDPDLARLFTAGPGRQAATTPTFLLVAGLALMVLGSIAAVVPVAVMGMLVSMVSLFAAYSRPTGFGYAGAA